MVAAISATIAVVGTLLGSVMTYLFQTRSAGRAEAFAFRQQLRSERMTVYSNFARALTEYRRGQYDWWNRRNEDPESQDTFDARREAYKLLGVAQHALSQVQLIADSRSLVDVARHSYELTQELRKASTEAELIAQGDAASLTLEQFIALASRSIQ